jgi:hypothetical protein
MTDPTTQTRIHQSTLKKLDQIRKTERRSRAAQLEIILDYYIRSRAVAFPIEKRNT